MNDEIKEVLAVLWAFLWFVCAIFTAWALLASASCSSRSEKMGVRSAWGPLQGCMIEYRPGKWIDINRYRAFDDDK